MQSSSLLSAKFPTLQSNSETSQRRSWVDKIALRNYFFICFSFGILQLIFVVFVCHGERLCGKLLMYPHLRSSQVSRKQRIKGKHKPFRNKRVKHQKKRFHFKGKRGSTNSVTKQHEQSHKPYVLCSATHLSHSRRFLLFWFFFLYVHGKIMISCQRSSMPKKKLKYNSKSFFSGTAEARKIREKKLVKRHLENLLAPKGALNWIFFFHSSTWRAESLLGPLRFLPHNEDTNLLCFSKQ